MVILKKKATKISDTKNVSVRKGTEEKLINAATQVFAQHGFKGATTRMIAQKANVNIALINRYFDGKMGLFFEVISRKSKSNLHAPIDYPVQETLSAECYHFLIMRLNRHIKEIKLFKIVFSQLLTDRNFQKKFNDSLIEFEDYAEISARIEKLKIDGKVASALEPLPFLEIISLHLIAVFICDHVICTKTYDDLDAQIKSFIRHICTPYEITT